MNLCEDFSKKFPETSETKSFTASKGWLHKFRNRFDLKNIIISRETASADEEGFCRILAELKKLIKEKEYYPKHVFHCNEIGSSGRRCLIESAFIKVQKRNPGTKYGRTH